MTVSHLEGPAWSPPPATSVGEALAALAATGRPWLTFYGKNQGTLSAEEGYRLARCWARAFLDAGCQLGDRVVLIVEPDHEVEVMAEKPATLSFAGHLLFRRKLCQHDFLAFTRYQSASGFRSNSQAFGVPFAPISAIRHLRHSG